MLQHLSETPQGQSPAQIGDCPLSIGHATTEDAHEEAPDKAELESDILPEMTALIRRIRRKSVLPVAMLAQLGQQTLPITTVRALLSLLQGPFMERWRERLVAVWALGRADLEPGHRRAVATVLMEVLAGGRTEGEVMGAVWRRTLPISSLIAGLTLIGSFISFGGFRDLGTYGDPVIAMSSTILARLVTAMMFALVVFGGSAVVLAPVVLPFSIATDSARNLRIRAAAATALGRLRQPKSIPLLSRTSLDLNPSVRRAAEAALCATLADLTIEHYGQLSLDTVSSLCQVLHIRRHQVFAGPILQERTEHLVICVLEALAMVGDGSALRLVESIAADGQSERVRRVAQQTVPILQERRQQETNRQSLLRGSQLPDTEPATLLRPAAEDSMAPESLLRPAVDTIDRPICMPLFRANDADKK